MEQSHDPLTAADDAHRVAVGDGLAEQAQIGRDVADLLVPAEAGPKTRLDLIEHEQRPMLVAQFAEVGQIARLGQHDADVLQDRLYHYTCDRPLAHHILDGVRVVEIDHVQMLQDIAGNARRQRQHGVLPAADARADLLDRGHDRPAHVIVPAVVPAQHQDDVIAAGVGSGQADAVGGGLAAGIGDLHPLQRRHRFAQQARQGHLPWRRPAAHQRFLPADRLDHGGVDSRIVVPKQMRRERGVVIDVLGPVDIVELAARGADKRNVRLDLAVQRHHAACNIPVG